MVNIIYHKTILNSAIFNVKKEPLAEQKHNSITRFKRFADKIMFAALIVFLQFKLYLCFLLNTIMLTRSETEKLYEGKNGPQQNLKFKSSIKLKLNLKACIDSEFLPGSAKSP